MPIWHQSPKLTPRYFLETPRLFGYPKNPPDIESLIAKEILPIRPNRQNERKVKAKSPVSFNYRYD